MEGPGRPVADPGRLDRQVQGLGLPPVCRHIPVAPPHRPLHAPGCAPLQRCLRAHLAGAEWAHALGQITAAQGLEPPGPLELIPVSGSDALVFMLGPMALKIFAHEVRRRFFAWPHRARVAPWTRPGILAS